MKDKLWRSNSVYTDSCQASSYRSTNTIRDMHAVIPYRLVAEALKNELFEFPLILGSDLLVFALGWIRKGAPPHARPRLRIFPIRRTLAVSGSNRVDRTRTGHLYVFTTSSSAKASRACYTTVLYMRVG